MSSESVTYSELSGRINEVMLRDRFRFRKRLKGLKNSGPGAPGLVKLAEQVEASQLLTEKRRAVLPDLRFPAELPVNEQRSEISRLISENQVVIVCGETGSGKSTQLPKICLEAGRGIFGKIGHTQPRRIAARSIASRIADELKVAVGSVVGHKIRFQDQTADTTLIKLMTDGILLAETQNDRFLEEYDTIIIDEAHERSLNIDFLLGFLKSILPRRPDLKLIITSATIDAGKFSQHFATADQTAPVIEVSGRSYPVEILYRPVDESFDQDLFDSINRAVEELLNDEQGDILVFLPTEKDIRTAAKKLRGLEYFRESGRKIDILPLYARLSSSDQNRIFSPGKENRIVLATNVAESSLTVPRIKYVIDSGTARISRYSARSKIQRLPIERISQASANQRAGRCGRLGPGTCIRLYSEEDFQTRDAFTTPEIRRTNLASVILQARAMHLGDIDRIDFLDPPRPESVRDGYKTLFEIGATDERRELTPLGHKIKKFPSDPRISKMILQGHEEGALADVLIVASALEVQDVRDRPVEKQKAADAAHEKFRDEESDFQSYLKIWDFYHDLKSRLSNSRVRKALQQSFLSFARIREWLEVYRQLKEICLRQKIKPGSRTNDFEKLHRALLSALLSGVALRGDRHEYTAAGGQKTYIWPGSGLIETGPKWVVSAEVVETSKTFIRNIARIQPSWIEPLANHLVSRSYSDPHWHEKSEKVMAFEKVTLFGNPIVPRRRVPYAKIDSAVSRSIFIEEGLVNRRLHSSPDFYKHNVELIQAAEDTASRTRRRDLVVDDHRVFAFYEERIPEDVCDLISLRKWLAAAGESEQCLKMNLDDLVDDCPDQVADQYPETIDARNVQIKLEYRFEPGSSNDGITASVPKPALANLNELRLDWLVPGMVEEKIASLIRSLPKAKRRSLIPAPDKASLAAKQIQFAEGRFLESVAKALSRISDEPISPDDFDLNKLDPHLMINIQVTDEKGTVIDQGRSLRELQEAHFDHQAGTNLLDAPDWNRSGITDWDFGDLESPISVDHGGMQVSAYPTLSDCKDSVALNLSPNQVAARAQLRFGIMRLAVIRQGKTLKKQLKWLPDFEKLAVIASQFTGRKTFDADIIDLIAKRAFVDNEKRSPTSAEEFEKLMDSPTERISIAAQEVAQLLPRLLNRYQELMLALADARPFQQDQGSRIRSQVKELLAPRFWIQVPWIWLERFPIYFQAAKIRLDKSVPGSTPTEKELDQQMDRLMASHRETAEKHHKLQIYDPELIRFRYMIEEYRISVFAQQLGTLVSVSPQRLDKQWSKIEK